jgi:uncharacterized membrane protein
MFNEGILVAAIFLVISMLAPGAEAAFGAGDAIMLIVGLAIGIVAILSVLGCVARRRGSA